MSIRKSRVAGQFYPEDKDELMEIIDIYLNETDKVEKRSIIGGIVPHAGYVYSGKCAAHFYKSIINSKFDVFIILGTNHSGFGEKVSLSLDDFQTPLGIVKNDIKLSEELLEFYQINEEAHKVEHSIEVQLPFLQVVRKKFTIVPILVRDLNIDEIEKLSNRIVSLIKGKKVCVIASSDFTHYGKGYGYVPKENIKDIDKKAIDKIIEFSLQGFLKDASKTTICGSIAIACCMEICRKLGSKKVEKLDYYTSSDISGDKNMAVGYASLAFV